MEKILKYAGLPGRALEALVVLIFVVILIFVLVTSSLTLVPGQSNAVIDAELLAVGVAGWLWVVTLTALNTRTLEPQRRIGRLFRVALAQLGVLPFVIAGAVTLAQGSANLYWLVPSVVFCFLVAFFDAWLLLFEINR